MNRTQLKCLLVMIVLALIGFGPLSLTCLIGLFVVIARPRWFFELVQDLYRNGGNKVPFAPPARSAAANVARCKAFVCLIGLLLLDIAPVPVAGSLGLYLVIARPKWFKAFVETLYFG
ncbi:hypothetical protein [Methylothermus subterraneus]